MTGNPTSRSSLRKLVVGAALGVVGVLLIHGGAVTPVRAATTYVPVFRTHPMIPAPAPHGGAGPGATNSSINLSWYSYNWSGYSVPGDVGGFSAVTGCWTVPTIEGALGDTFSSAWIGIDGWSNDDLIQVGTAQDFLYETDSYLYSAWWEILPAVATPITMTVDPGDLMCAGITEGASDNWTISIANSSREERFSTVQQYTGPQDSAEWIVEAPDVCPLTGCRPTTLADYGQTTFGPLSANGANPGLTPGEGGYMVDGDDYIASMPSNPNANTDAFAIAYYPTAQPSAPASPNPTISSLNPVVGPESGGEWVTFSGTGIAPGAAVQFGTSLSPGVTFTSNSQLTALTPPGSGTVAVTVTNPDGGSFTDPAAYSYGLDAEAAIRGGTVASGDWRGWPPPRRCSRAPGRIRVGSPLNRPAWSRCPPARASASLST